jgi:hypothetical protein
LRIFVYVQRKERERERDVHENEFFSRKASSCEAAQVPGDVVEIKK